jgi:phage N-6-adenine-methyltransferase
MLTHDKATIHSSLDPDWGTPLEMYQAIERDFARNDRGGFFLDVAADKTNNKCPLWLGPGGIHDDALTFSDWQDFTGASVFMNPPWSRERKIKIEPFIILAKTISRLYDIRFVCILPASIQTGWWFHHVWNWAHTIRFIPHRVNFEASDAMLNYINAKRMKKGHDPIEETWNAAGNTSVVVFDGHKVVTRPDVDYWTYRADWSKDLIDG